MPSTMVNSVYNPSGDGNCDFKAHAKCILRDENQWKTVKLALCSRLRTNLSMYQKAFDYDTAALLRILEYQLAPCSPSSGFLYLIVRS